MNVFDRVNGLNKRVRELELELRVHKLEKVLRELVEQIDEDVPEENITRHFADVLFDARYLIKEHTGQGV
jgi:hypothetical protein